MHLRKIVWKRGLQKMKLRTKVEAERKRRGKRILEIGFDGGIGGTDFCRIVEFIIEDRHRQSAVRRDKGG